jgi:hypothetical protein
MNTNFSVFRGHILPLDPNTATSINNTYDLGSSEYNWRRVYTKGLYLPSGYSSTAAISGIAATAKINASIYTTTSTPIAGSTLTISTTGRPVEYALFGSGGLGTVQTGAGATASNFAFCTLFRDGSSIAVISVYWPLSEPSFTHPPGGFRFIDTTVAAGTYKYHIQGHITTKTGITIAQLDGAWICREL